MAYEKLLELRKAMKRRKPRFIAQDSHKKKKVAQKWRRPRGAHSKLGRRGYKKRAKAGYGSPSLVKNMTKEGQIPINISNSALLTGLDKKKHCAIIGKKVGMKKRKHILNECKKLGLNVSNVPDIDAYLKSIDEILSRKKESRKKKEERKTTGKKAEKKKKETPKEKKEPEPAAAEDKEMAEKKEQDKILVTKG
ncbi:hypothetical protein GF371_03010 [Candidatus Woesearchaeota archaeon]|nr:hypothetical protein [Candidatus Woesearchaeota archaeon]